MPVIMKSSSFLMKSKIFKVNLSTTHGKKLAHIICIFRPNNCHFLAHTVTLMSVSGKLAALSCSQHSLNFLGFHRN